MALLPVFFAFTFLHSLVYGQNFSLMNYPGASFPAQVSCYTVIYEPFENVLYIAGTTYTSFDTQSYYNDTAYDAFVSKCALNGTRLWTRFVSGPSYQAIQVLISDPVSKTIYAFGQSSGSVYGIPVAAPSAMMVSFDRSGNVTGKSIFGAGPASSITGGNLDSKGNFVLSGQLNNTGAIMIVATNGTLLQSLSPAWVYGCQGLVASELADVYYVVGAYQNQTTFNSNAYLAKVNPYTRAIFWERTWTGDINTQAQGLAVAFDQSSSVVYIVGYGDGSVNGGAYNSGFDAILIATFSNGSYYFTTEFGTGLDDSASSIFIHPISKNLFVAGSWFSNYGFLASFDPKGQLLQLQNSSLLYTGFSNMAVLPSYNQIYLSDSFSGNFFVAQVANASVVTSSSTVATSSTVASFSSASSSSLGVISSSSSLIFTTSIKSSTAIISSSSSIMATGVSSAVITPALTSATVSSVTKTTSIQSSSVTLATSVISVSSAQSSTVSQSSTSVISSFGVQSSTLSQSSAATTYSSMATSTSTRQGMPGLSLDPIDSLSTDAVQHSTPSSQAFDQPNNNMTLIIAAAAGVAAIFLIIAGLIWRRKHNGAKSLSKTKSMGQSSTSLLTSFSNRPIKSIEGSYENTTFTGGNTTWMRTDFGLFLPGYLHYEIGTGFRFIKQIAKGGGGTVHIAEPLHPDLMEKSPKMVVKVVGGKTAQASYSNLSEFEQKMFTQEIAIMHYLRAEKNIAKLYGWTREPPCMLMKYYPLGSLRHWLDKSTNAKTRRLLHGFMIDIASGIESMHRVGMLHADIKPQNVLVDQDEQTGTLFCVLTDFGITQIVNEKTLLVKDFKPVKINGFSVRYAAPEVFQRNRASFSVDLRGDEAMKSDVYSISMIIYELICQKLPFGK